MKYTVYQISDQCLFLPRCITVLRLAKTPSWCRMDLVLKLCLAKIPSACIFIAFHRARVGRLSQLSTVKTSGLRFNSTVGRSFGQAQAAKLPIKSWAFSP